jgi:hypothetical protein
MGNSLLAVRDINHKYIVVGGKSSPRTKKLGFFLRKNKPANKKSRLN